MFKNRKPKLLDTTLASVTMRNIGLKDNNGKIKISQIMEDFHENGILLAIIFFALPVAIPLPYPPGLKAIMCIPLIILSIQMIIGSKLVRLPIKINDYELNYSTLKKISNKIAPILESAEKYTKPRMSFARSVYCEQFVGLSMLIGGIAIALPLPFINVLPALGVTMMAFGLLNRDGLIIIGGFAITVIGTSIAVAAILTSWALIKHFFYFIF